MTEPIVSTPSGPVRGLPGKVFLGIPYAARPVRFRFAEPVTPWKEALDATRFGPSPMQSPDSPFSGLLPGNTVAATSEDSLTLNIWAPPGASGLPVLVWVPGGAFLTGGTCVETYDGARLAHEHQVIVVSVNYRLGAFGFLWHDGCDPNCGLADVALALRWVRDNIESFGGDADNVTAFGESAGAGCLLHLLASKAGGGLVQRAILQSPGVDHTLLPSQATQVTEALLRHVEADRLGDVPAQALLDAQEKAVMETIGTVSAMPFHPVVDGDFLRHTPSEAFADGAAGEVDLLISWTSDEMSLFPSPAAGRADVVRWSSRQFPHVDADALVDFYDGDWAAIQTDGLMRLPARRIAGLHGGKTFACEFAWGSPAFHAIDLPFTFGTLDRCGWAEYLHAGPGARVLADQHMAAWATFALDGRPAVPGVEQWPLYGSKDRRTMIFDEPCALVPDPLSEAAEVWGTPL